MSCCAWPSAICSPSSSDNFRQNAWWIQAGSAPAPPVPGATSIWAVGSNGQITAVLHLPQGRSRADGLARFRAVLMVQ